MFIFKNNLNLFYVLYNRKILISFEIYFWKFVENKLFGISVFRDGIRRCGRIKGMLGNLLLLYLLLDGDFVFVW